MRHRPALGLFQPELDCGERRLGARGARGERGEVSDKAVEGGGRSVTRRWKGSDTTVGKAEECQWKGCEKAAEGQGKVVEGQ